MPDILLERDGDVAVVMLNRPERMNAVTLSMLADLTRVLGELDGDDDVGAVVLTGIGRGFCAGGDVKGMAEGPPRSFEGRVADLRQRHRAPLLLRTMSKLVVAAVNGPAMGAGLSLALACDLRIASSNARFATAFANVGLSGDFGGSQTLQRLVGATQAREFYYGAKTADADEALRIGLVGRVVSPDALMEESLRTAAEIAAGPRVAYAYMKRNLLAAETEPFERMLEIEGLHQTRTSSTEDHEEAKAAFAERRQPRFTGR